MKGLFRWAKGLISVGQDRSFGRRTHAREEGEAKRRCKEDRAERRQDERDGKVNPAVARVEGVSLIVDSVVELGATDVTFRGRCESLDLKVGELESQPGCRRDRVWIREKRRIDEWMRITLEELGRIERGGRLLEATSGKPCCLLARIRREIGC